MTQLKKMVTIATVSMGTVALLLSNAPFTYADSSSTAYTMPQAPSVLAKSVVLMNAENGQILYSLDPDQRRAPASTTKLMTMYLAMKALAQHQVSLSDEVPVTPDAYKVAIEPGVSDAYLDPKEHFTMEDMLKFISVISANDATVAVADKLGGDQTAFVDEMNQEAQVLHLTNTHYMNPDGLQENNHYTSARDLATLARALVLQYPAILKYTSLPYVTVRKGNTWESTDELIGHYPGADGLKTGYTSDAGYCYVGTAEQNGVRLIVVVMADTTTDIHQRFRDAAKLLDFGFHDFHQITVAKQSEPLSSKVAVANGSQTNLPVTVQTDFVVDLPTGVQGSVKLTSDKVSAPIKAGQQVGTVEYQVNGQTIATAPAVALSADGKANWFVRLLRSIGHAIASLLHRL